MKNVSIALLALLVFCGRESGAETRVTVYCDDNYPPYSYVEGGKVKGIYTEVVRRAFSAMAGYAVTIEAVPWKRGLHLLESGTGFALFPPYHRSGERPYMDYSVRILDERLVIFLRQGVAEKRRLHSWPFDYYGLRVGKNKGFLVSQNRDYLEAVRAGKITVEEAKDNRANVLKLGMGRIDAYINDRLSVLWTISRLKRAGVYDAGGLHERIIEGITLSTEYGHLGYTNRDEGRFAFKGDFIARFNAVIEAMKKNGEIEEIIVEGYLK